MSDAPSPGFTSPGVSEIRRLSECLHLLFGRSTDGDNLAARCRRAIDELGAFADGRGVLTAVIAVTGAKNSGKSWMCRMLVANDAVRERIPSGETSASSTEKATWIGPDAPPRLDAKHEIRIALRAADMVDLGSPYTLLDLPGFNDATVAARGAALDALRGSALRVFMVSGATMADESQLDFLANSDGTRILPVVVDESYPRIETEGGDDVASMVRRIRRHCPHAEVLDPVVVPHLRHCAPGDASLLAQQAQQRLLPVLRKMIALPPMDEHVIGRVVIERLRRDLAGDLKEFVQRVAPAHDALEMMESTIAAELVQRTLGPDPQLEAGLRIRMRLFAQTRTPGWFFPFRTFFGLFSITAGAWDRMAIAMAGSLPSLALLFFQTAKNAARLGEMKDEARSALASRIENLARDELANCNRRFIRSINASLPNEERRQEDASPPTRLIGLERVIEQSGEIFERIVRQYAGGRTESLLLGALATLLFAGLLSGPLAAVYREYGRAWVCVFNAPDGCLWPAFPAPSAGMIFTSLMLATLPVVLCAMASCLRATPLSRVRLAVEAAKADHDAMLNRLAKDRTVRLVSDDPVREAVRAVLDFVRRGK